MLRTALFLWVTSSIAVFLRVAEVPLFMGATARFYLLLGLVSSLALIVSTYRSLIAHKLSRTNALRVSSLLLSPREKPLEILPATARYTTFRTRAKIAA